MSPATSPGPLPAGPTSAPAGPVVARGSAAREAERRQGPGPRPRRGRGPVVARGSAAREAERPRRARIDGPAVKPCALLRPACAAAAALARRRPARRRRGGPGVGRLGRLRGHGARPARRSLSATRSPGPCACGSAARSANCRPALRRRLRRGEAHSRHGGKELRGPRPPLRSRPPTAVRSAPAVKPWSAARPARRRAGARWTRLQACGRDRRRARGAIPSRAFSPRPQPPRRAPPAPDPRASARRPSRRSRGSCARWSRRSPGAP